MNEFTIGVLSGLLLGLICGSLFVMTQSRPNQYWHSLMVKNNCAHFDARTGAFKEGKAP